jgi:hypothetical protein
MTDRHLSCLKIAIPALLGSLLAGCGNASDHSSLAPPKAASEVLYATNFEGITSFPINVPSFGGINCREQAWVLKNSFQGISKTKFVRKLLNVRSR